MDTISRIINNNGFEWEWHKGLEIPCIAYKQTASDNETVISYNFAIKYDDLVESNMVDDGNLDKSFVEFERKYFSKYFFREDTDLKWNYYLLIIVNVDESSNPDICQLEQDDKYLRKLVMTEDEFDVYISHGKNIKENPSQAINGTDTYAEWKRELNEIEIEGILFYPFENARVQNYLEKNTSIRSQGKPIQNWENAKQGNPQFLVKKIETLSLNGFRGHCLAAQMEIPLTKVNLISGCNGTGKSSICSALEYAITGEISDAENEDGEAKVIFKNRENVRMDLSSKMSTKKKKELDKLWYGTVKTGGKSSLNTNFHTFNYLGLEASGKYMQELDINELVKNVLFGTEVTEAEQKMHRYEKAFSDKEKEYRRQLNKICLEIKEFYPDEDVKNISREEIADKFRRLGYKGDCSGDDQKMDAFLDGCRTIILQNNQYTEKLFLTCNKVETGNTIMERMQLLDENRSIYLDLIESRERTRQNLQEIRQKIGDSKISISQLYGKINYVQVLIQQEGSIKHQFLCRQDFLQLKNEFEQQKSTKETLEKWLDDSQEYIYVEQDEESLNKGIEFKENRIRELSDEIDEVQRQIELQKKQNDDLETMVQEIVSLTQQYVSTNKHAKDCPVCGRKFDAHDKFLKAVSRQRQLKIKDETLLNSFLEQKIKKQEQLVTERMELSQLKKDREKVLKKRTAILKLKSLMSIDESKKGEDIKKEVSSHLASLQDYLEHNINTYEYVIKILKENKFVEYPKNEDWFVHLKKVLRNLEEQKDESEVMLKSQSDREQELNQEYQRLMEKEIIFSEQEWEMCRLKANGIQALNKTWEIDGDIPILHWIENYNTLKQEMQYAEEVYRKQQEMDFRKKQIAKLEEEKSTIENRIKKCQTVCRVIGRQKKLEDVMEGFLKENARQIELFFKLLHRPKEFGSLKIEDGKISFVRNSNRQLAKSSQMSTGQRMALAFSVMITLHIRAVNAPNFLMLDEPVANLDDMHVLNLIDLLRELAISGTQIIITTADSQMAKFLRRKFSFLKDEYSHFELTRKGDTQTLIEVIHYRPDRKAAENIQRL